MADWCTLIGAMILCFAPNLAIKQDYEVSASAFDFVCFAFQFFQGDFVLAIRYFEF